MAISNLKKVVAVAFLGAVLFVASFVVSDRINAYDIFCEPTAIWFDVFGNEQCGPIGGAPPAPMGGAVGGEMWMASYYGYSHAGNMTASGVPFDPTGFTAAHKTLPFGTQLRVGYGGNSTVVTVNDRGPYVDGRDVDLSQAAAETIGLTGPGVAPVQVTVL
ncbi:MAG: septal ring lytic transglycosylase RlpA family protein [Actinomycetota bacterium]|nr:septal ring lytic transglycosylase RlpA family protein [Actinomycetota bacterium]